MSSEPYSDLSPVAGEAGEMVVLLVVDSHLVFADALADQLRKEIGPREVCVAHSLEEARTTLGKQRSDVVVVHDERRVHEELGTLHGLASQQDVDALILVLSGNEDVATIIAALRAGARGWISKDMDLHSLVEAIGQVAQGHLFLSPPVLTSVVRELLDTAPPVRGSHSFIDSLSQRELQILRCLVAGMSKQEIAAHLFLSIHTVRSHVHRMMKRADQHSTLSLVAMARHVGVPPIELDHEEQPPQPVADTEPS